ncbi:unnamed protein product [Nezara viridula]|uniref:Uncharacterized protein n=1 Tax=Nezara viridula TaxID=85310 RepID=A0A9P0E6F4_NEZVI|nr:unnamed protein product [Nezara viridula]
MAEITGRYQLQTNEQATTQLSFDTAAILAALTSFKLEETTIKQETESEDVTIVQSCSFQDEEPLGSNDDENTMETKHDEYPINIPVTDNIVVNDNEDLDESRANEEIKETTDGKDCENTIIAEESMVEIINDSEPSGAEKEKNIDEEKEILIGNELMKEDEYRSDNINPNFPVIEETNVDIVSEDKKGETLTDITTNDRSSKPNDQVMDIRYSEEIKPDKGPYRIKQKIVVIDSG